MDAAGALLLGWSFAVASVSARAVMLAGSARRPSTALLEGARVLVIRPCAGDEPGLERALGSLATATWSFELRLVLAVASYRDRAMAGAVRARAALVQGGIEAEVMLTGACAPNRKADQLARVLAREATAEYVIVADSDVDLAGVDLDALVAPLVEDAGLGACWAPPVEVGPAVTFGDRASMAVLGGSLHAFPLLGRLDPRGLVGKLVALRASALEQAGGFVALVRHLGEDMELSRRLAASGGAVAMAPFVARSLASGRSLAAVASRYGRWLAVLRAQRAALLFSYPLLLCATPLIVAAATIVVWSSPGAAVGASALAIAARLAVALRAQASAGRRVSLGAGAVDALLADALLLAALLRAVSSRHITWRDTKLRLGAGGLLDEGGPRSPRARATRAQRRRPSLTPPRGACP